MKIPYKKALLFVILIGVVSFFSDMTYEAARSISGQYLAYLGASAFIVGAVSGFGELVGYSFRLISGSLSDTTKRYWTIAFVGYILNLFSVPLLAFTGSLFWASLLLILERLGKGIRNPARDAMLSFAVKATGRGFGFGLHQALDRLGAVVGPLLVSYALFKTASYRFSFLILFVPAIFSLVTLLFAQRQYPRPSDMEREETPLMWKGFSKKFWLYIIGVSFLACGYVDFPLIAYHFLKKANTEETVIPLLYAIAMGVCALSGLLVGRLYDKIGVKVLTLTTFFVAFSTPLLYLDSLLLSLVGILLWGFGLGAQESIIPSFLADIIPVNKRGTAFGLLNLLFGISWFIGSALMGYLYTIQIEYLVIFSFVCQLLAIPFFLVTSRI